MVDLYGLTKLSSYGVSGREPEWFESYLTGRKYCCIFERKHSTMKEATCGISQGSYLGPLFFLIYINDVPFALKHYTASIFTDDSGIMVASNNVNELQSLLQEDMYSLVE